MQNDYFLLVRNLENYKQVNPVIKNFDTVYPRICPPGGLFIIYGFLHGGLFDGGGGLKKPF